MAFQDLLIAVTPVHHFFLFSVVCYQCNMFSLFHPKCYKSVFHFHRSLLFFDLLAVLFVFFYYFTLLFIDAVRRHKSTHTGQRVDIALLSDYASRV